MPAFNSLRVAALAFTLTTLLAQTPAGASPPEATILLKRARTCAEAGALLVRTSFKLKCPSGPKQKARAYDAKYFGSESMAKALEALRKHDEIVDADPKAAFPIAR